MYLMNIQNRRNVFRKPCFNHREATYLDSHARLHSDFSSYRGISKENYTTGEPLSPTTKIIKGKNALANEQPDFSSHVLIVFRKEIEGR